MHHVDWNKREWLLLLQERHILTQSLERSNYNKHERSSQLQRRLKHESSIGNHNTNSVSLSDVSFWWSFSKSSPNLPRSFEFTQCGRRPEKLKMFPSPIPPWGVWGGNRKMHSQQHPWHWLMKQTPSSQVQSCIYYSVFFWWSLETKNLNSSICFQRWTHLGVFVWLTSLIWSDPLVIKGVNCSFRFLTRNEPPDQASKKQDEAYCVPLGAELFVDFDPQINNWASEASAASRWMLGMRRMTQRSQQELAGWTSITPLLRSAGGL